MGLQQKTQKRSFKAQRERCCSISSKNTPLGGFPEVLFLKKKKKDELRESIIVPYSIETSFP
jgi:hypothetical protein